MWRPGLIQGRVLDKHRLSLAHCGEVLIGNTELTFLPLSGRILGASLVTQTVKNLLAIKETLYWEDLLDKGIATLSCLENSMDRGA